MNKLAAFFLFLAILTTWVCTYFATHGHDWIIFPSFLSIMCLLALFFILLMRTNKIPEIDFLV